MHIWGKYIKKYRILFCLALLCLMLETFCDLMQPTIMSQIVDIGVAGRRMDFVLRMGGIMLGITLIGALAATGRNILSSIVSQNFGAELRLDLFRKINYFSYPNIDQFEPASLITRLTNDVSQVQVFVNGTMRIFVKAPLLCIGSIIMAVRLDMPTASVLLLVVPVIGFLILSNMHFGYPLFRKVQKSMDHVNGVMREYLSGVRVVKAFNRFDYEMERFDKVNGELASNATSASRVGALFSPCISLVLNLGIIAIFWIGGYRVSGGQMHVGQIMAFINYMTQILFSLTMISFVFTMFVRAKASSERIGEVFEQADNMQDGSITVESGHHPGHIEFEDVTFSYEGAGGDPILRNISFCCNPGETIGIIGSTGAGKTSLVNLIPRFYDATAGAIKINGVNNREYEMAALRRMIAIVPQKTVLFSGSILENIKWGRGDAAPEEIEHAASMAQAHEFITGFPEGYQTILGQGGVNLSGGQKQRISIARALVRHPDILILDDCTSAVDTNTESRIKSALKHYAHGTTCLIITQRITSIMDADRILVMDNGEIVGMGTHKELLDHNSVYQDIFRSQFGKEVV